MILVTGAAYMWISGNLDINRDEQQFMLAIGLLIAAFGAIVMLWSGTWIVRQLRGFDQRSR